MPKKVSKIFEESVEYAGGVIEFTLILSKRKSLSIEVHPDKSIKVRAPLRSSIKGVKKKVLKTAEWIEKKQKHFTDNPVKTITKPRYEEGEPFHFLGKKYQLQPRKGIASRAYINEEKQELIVEMPVLKASKIKKLVEYWFRQEAEQVFYERLEPCKRLAEEKIGIKHKGELRLRQMRRRWGSCSKHGEITLNYELAKAHPECIDYVILHELCHLIEFNHSPAFYKLMARVLPDWKVRKANLNRINELEYSE